jgi:hypothetical protein
MSQFVKGLLPSVSRVLSERRNASSRRGDYDGGMNKSAPIAKLLCAALLLAGIAAAISQGDFGFRDVVGSLVLPTLLIISAVQFGRWESS